MEQLKQRAPIIKDKRVPAMEIKREMINIITLDDIKNCLIEMYTDVSDADEHYLKTGEKPRELHKISMTPIDGIYDLLKRVNATYFDIVSKDENVAMARGRMCISQQAARTKALKDSLY